MLRILWVWLVWRLRVNDVCAWCGASFPTVFTWWWHQLFHWPKVPEEARELLRRVKSGDYDHA